MRLQLAALSRSTLGAESFLHAEYSIICARFVFVFGILVGKVRFFSTNGVPSFFDNYSLGLTLISFSFLNDLEVVHYLC